MTVTETALTILPSTAISQTGQPAEKAQAPVNLASIRILEQRVFLKMQDFQREQTLSKRAQTLATVKENLKALRGDCRALQNDCELAYNNLSWYNMLSTAEYFLAKHGCDFVSSLSSSQYVQLGTSYHAVSALLYKLSARIQGLVADEIVKLRALSLTKCADSLNTIGMYEALHDIQAEDSPQKTTLLEELSQKLFQEKAYEAADRVLSRIAKNILDRPDLKILKIRILIGLEQFEAANEMIVSAKQALADLPQETRQKPYNVDFEKRLDELHAECLTYKDNFDDAIKTYQHLIKQNPLNKKNLHWAIVVCAIRQELKNVNTAEDLAAKGKFFLAKAKQMFSKLEEYQDVVWGEDNLIIDFEFWLTVLFTQKKANDNEAIKLFLYIKLKELVDTDVISRETLMATVDKFMGRLKIAHRCFEESFDDLIMGGAEVSQASSLQDLQQDVARARKRQLEYIQSGDNTLYGTAGILRTRNIANELLQFLQGHERFKEPLVQARLITYHNRSEIRDDVASRCSLVLDKIQGVLMLQSPQQTPQLEAPTGSGSGSAKSPSPIVTEVE